MLLQGGVHADLPFSFYEEMFRYIRKTFPTIHLHALSAPEVYFLQKITKWPMRDVIARLRDAGLQSIPGGGAEILEDSVRKRIWSLTKAPTEKWVDVHESAHAPGHAHDGDDDVRRGGDATRSASSTCEVVRDLQDRTGGFTAWIPWTFQKENTELDGKVDEAGGFEYLKTLAVSRLFLDNIRHVQGSWVTQGPKIGQVSLSFGARRPRLDHDRGERRLRRRRAQPDDAGRDAPHHRRRRVRARAAAHALRRVHRTPAARRPIPATRGRGAATPCRVHGARPRLEPRLGVRSRGRGG